MTVPGAIKALEKLADQFGDQIVLGAGTVLDPETARICMLAGAQFFVLLDRALGFHFFDAFVGAGRDRPRGGRVLTFCR